MTGCSEEIGWHFQFVCKSLITDLTPVASEGPGEAARWRLGASGRATTLAGLHPLVALSPDAPLLDILKT